MRDMAQDIRELAAPDVAAVLGRSATAVVSFGSVEQHGPHLPCGTDTMAAELVGQEVARRLDALHVPFGPYGVTPIHAGHPGTVNLRRQTFEMLATDVCAELIRMGAAKLVLVNWHEGNNASIDAVATQLQDAHGAVFAVAHACYVAQRVYASSGGELTHGGGIETLAVLAHDPALVRIERAGEPSRPPHAAKLDAMRRSRDVYGFVTDVTEMAPDGWYGQPRWATEERAATFAAVVTDALMERLEEVLTARVAPSTTGRQDGDADGGGA
jgi:creatinine amidohydrolase